MSFEAKREDGNGDETDTYSGNNFCPRRRVWLVKEGPDMGFNPHPVGHLPRPVGLFPAELFHPVLLAGLWIQVAKAVRVQPIQNGQGFLGVAMLSVLKKLTEKYVFRLKEYSKNRTVIQQHGSTWFASKPQYSSSFLGKKIFIAKNRNMY
jgi:hypothetical protein